MENELADVEGKNKKEIGVKSERVLRSWLDMEQRYRDPVSSGHIVLPKKGGDS